jgi:hypothetical protein
VWRAGATVVDIDGRVDAGRLLEALRRAGVQHVDAVVARAATPSTADGLDALARRYPDARVLTPSSIRVPMAFSMGALVIELVPFDDRLTVEIAVAPSGTTRGRGRGPPV